MIVACLVWFDEDPVMLAASVASWGPLCDAVVAVDGAFAGFPGVRARSATEQRRAIFAAASGAGMDARVFVKGNLSQVEKRSEAFRLAGRYLARRRGDWLLVVDADEQLAEETDADLTRSLLAGTARDVAEISAEIDGSPVPQRRLVRAGLGVRCEGLHYRYVTADGRALWNYPGEPQEPCVRVPVRLSHRRDLRSADRQARSEAYYDQRRETIS